MMDDGGDKEEDCNDFYGGGGDNKDGCCDYEMVISMTKCGVMRFTLTLLITF